MKKLMLISVLSLTPIISNAANNYESCNALLNLGVYNVNQSSNASEAQSLALSSFCAADYSNIEESSSVAASIRGSYGLFSAGASGSVSRSDVITKQSQVCSSGFNSSKYSANASDYSKTVYQGSLDAWNKCQTLANKGLVFDVQPSSTLQGLSVSITAPSGLSAIFYGVAQYGSGKSNCSVMANGKVSTKPFKFNASSKVTVNCVRQIETNGNDLTADAQDLVFVTSADNLTIPLAPIGNFSRMTVDQVKISAKQDIQSFIDITNKQISALNAQMNNAGTNSIDFTVNTTVTAPKVSGTYTLTKGIYTVLAYHCGASWNPNYYMTEGIIGILTGSIIGEISRHYDQPTAYTNYDSLIGIFSVTSDTATVEVGYAHHSNDGNVTIPGVDNNGSCQHMRVRQIF